VIARRALLGWAAASSAAAVSTSVLGCDRPSLARGEGRADPASAPSGTGPIPGTSAPASTAEAGPRWRELELEGNASFRDPGRVTVRPEPGAPLLVALHGAGENAKGLVGGSRGFRDDYGLDRAYARLAAPPLVEGDLGGFVRCDRLAALNSALAARPFAGVSVACPFTPYVQDLEGAKRWAGWLEEVLLPRAREAGGTAADAPSGIDGISMGGRLALLVGFARPDLFAAVGASQPAVKPDEVRYFANLAAKAHATRPRPLRLVSSQGDFYLEAIRALSLALRRRDVPHQLLVTPGPHDYPWNRGPGSTEMLVFHDRVLRGAPPV
jgi:predicted esterase